MNEKNEKLSLDKLAIYQIKVPGELDVGWLDLANTLEISIERQDQDYPISSLVGTFDQARLHSLLRRLYSMGLPLISVTCLDSA